MLSWVAAAATRQLQDRPHHCFCTCSVAVWRETSTLQEQKRSTTCWRNCERSVCVSSGYSQSSSGSRRTAMRTSWRRDHRASYSFRLTALYLVSAYWYMCIVLILRRHTGIYVSCSYKYNVMTVSRHYMYRAHTTISSSRMVSDDALEQRIRCVLTYAHICSRMLTYDSEGALEQWIRGVFCSTRHSVLSRALPLAGLMWFTYCRCLRNHLKCHFLQIQLNNWWLYMLQQSIKVSLIAVSVEQLIYLFLTRCCLLPILPITLQRHPCPLGSQNYFNQDGCGWGSRVRI